MKQKIIVQSIETGITFIQEVEYTEGEIKHIMLIHNCERGAAINLANNETLDEYEQGFYRAIVIP